MGGGIFLPDKTFVQSSRLHKGGGGGWPKTEIPQDIPLRKGLYIYIGWMHETWGHAFTDCIKKFWYLRTDEGKRLLAQGAKLVFLSTTNSLPHPNIVQLIALCGVNLSEHRLETEVARYETIIVPDDSFFGGYDEKGFTTEYLQEISIMRDNIARMLENQPLKKYDKIYFSRKYIRFNPPRDYCESGIEQVFKKLGYHVVYPETLSLTEQLFLLTHCRHFATTEGSVSHSAIFCHPGTKVEIIRKCNWPNLYQAIVNEVTDIEITYIDAHKTVNLWNGLEYYGPFFMNVNHNLKRFAGKRVYICYRPYWAYYRWWYQKFHNRRAFKRLEILLDHIGIHLSPYYSPQKKSS